MHDIAKSEGIIDKQHPDNSALFTKNIMEKYSFSKEINDRIFEIVKNHHWLEKYNTGAYTPAYTASLFRHKNDYLMAKIMANSDLRAISDSFYDAFLSTSCVSPGDCKTFCDMPFAVSFDCEKQNIASI